MSGKYHTKYQVIVMGKPANQNPIGENLDPLGVTVSYQITVLKRMKNILPFEIRRAIFVCLTG